MYLMATSQTHDCYNVVHLFQFIVRWYFFLSSVFNLLLYLDGVILAAEVGSPLPLINPLLLSWCSHNHLSGSIQCTWVYSFFVTWHPSPHCTSTNIMVRSTLLSREEGLCALQAESWLCQGKNVTEQLVWALLTAIRKQREIIPENHSMKFELSFSEDCFPVSHVSSVFSM